MINWEKLLIGMEIEEAEMIVGKEKMFLRITKNNGENYWGTQDLRNDRVNVEVDKGIIVAFNGIY